MNKITGCTMNDLSWKDSQGKEYHLDIDHMKGISYVDEEEAKEVFNYFSSRGVNELKEAYQSRFDEAVSINNITLDYWGWIDSYVITFIIEERVK